MNNAIIYRKVGITSSKIFTLLASVMLCQNTFFKYFEVIIGKLPVVSIFRPFFFPVLYFILILLSVKKDRFKYVRVMDIFIVMFFTMSILITCIFYPNNEPFIIESLLTEILPCIPFFLLGLCITIDEETFTVVSNISCIAVIASVLYVFYFIGSSRTLGGSHGENYSMYWSYLLLPNTMIVIEYAFRTKKIVPIACSVIGILYAFAMGTRGAIVIIFVFVSVNIWRYLEMRTSKKMLCVALISFLAIEFFVSPIYMQTLLMLKDFLADNGVSTRVVDYLINGEIISYTSGRDDIFQVLLSRLEERPFKGYGVFGEYPLGYKSGAHNIYLQVVFNFGYPLGIVLLVAYIGVFLNALRYAKGKISQEWIILFGCIVFVKGIFGGSYLDYSVFFLLGLCLREIRDEKDCTNLELVGGQYD